MGRMEWISALMRPATMAFEVATIPLGMLKGRSFGSVSRVRVTYWEYPDGCLPSLYTYLPFARISNRFGHTGIILWKPTAISEHTSLQFESLPRIIWTATLTSVTKDLERHISLALPPTSGGLKLEIEAIAA